MVTRSCHHCGTAVTEGFTCPACGAFVPDLPPEIMADEPASPSGPDQPFPRDATDRPDGAAGAGGAGRTFPAWAVRNGDERPPAATGPAPGADDPLALGAGPSTPAGGLPPDRSAPPSFPGWAVRRDVDAGHEPRPAPPPSLAAQLGRPVPPPAPSPPSSRSPVVVAALVAGALVVLLVAAVVLLRPADTDTVADDITGTCFVYGSRPGRVDRTVPCDELHDGKVLASVADRTACPAGTTAVLTTERDVEGDDGVLCIAEPG